MRANGTRGIIINAGGPKLITNLIVTLKVGLLTCCLAKSLYELLKYTSVCVENHSLATEMCFSDILDIFLELYLPMHFAFRKDVG